MLVIVDAYALCLSVFTSYVDLSVYF